LAPTDIIPPSSRLTRIEHKQTLRWLAQNQDLKGGFCGRTGKEPDACYCFWCGASLDIIGEKAIVNNTALASFVAQCQYKFGGIAKAPEEDPDPYHTYLSCAAIAITPPETDDPSWKLQPLDALLNATLETARWAKDHITIPKP